METTSAPRSDLHPTLVLNVPTHQVVLPPHSLPCSKHPTDEGEPDASVAFSYLPQEFSHNAVLMRYFHAVSAITRDPLNVRLKSQKNFVSQGEEKQENRSHY